MKRECLCIVFFLVCFIGGFGSIISAQQDTTAKVVRHKLNPATIRQDHKDVPVSTTPAATQPATPAKAPSQGLPASVQPIHENDSDTKPKN